MNIGDFRQKYPQYQDMSDQDLADKFYTKYYSDMPKEQFTSQFLGTQPTSLQRTVPQTWMQRVGGLAQKAAPFAQAALMGPAAQGEGDFSPMASSVMSMAGAKPAPALRNLPQNIPQMSMAGRFGPVMGAGVNAARLAVNAVQPGRDIAKEIPDKSIAYGVTGMLAPGGEEGLAGKALDAAIDKGIAKGIRPSAVGINDYRGFKNYISKARDAVKTIFGNKNNLQLTNEFGEPTGKLPQTLDQFSQAVSQTKAAIFKQYDAMAKAAGEQGAKVELEPLAKEFDKVATDKINMRLHPEVAKYAAEKANALRQIGSMAPEEAQAEIAHSNAVTKAFQQNPNPSAIKNTTAEAMYGNMLRKGLDDSIESIKGPGYQELKNKYGALKTIEKDVAHRSIVDARKNNKQLIDFSDIASAAELSKGLLTVNPASVGASGVMKLVSAYYKHVNNPNTAIKSMFSDFEKSGPATGRALGMGATQAAAQRIGNTLQPSPTESQRMRNALDPAQSAQAAWYKETDPELRKSEAYLTFANGPLNRLAQNRGMIGPVKQNPPYREPMPAQKQQNLPKANPNVKLIQTAQQSYVDGDYDTTIKTLVDLIRRDPKMAEAYKRMLEDTQRVQQGTNAALQRTAMLQGGMVQ